MAVLSNELINFITLTMNQSHVPLIVKGFELLHLAQKPDYELKYLELDEESEDLDPNMVPDIIFNYMILDMIGIIEAHGIFLNEGYSRNLPLLLTVVDVLYKLQTTENYDQVERILSSYHDNKYKLALIINLLSDKEVIVLLELFNRVEDTLFEMLVKVIAENTALLESEEEDKIDLEHEKRFLSYLRMIGDHPAVASYLYNKGYRFNLTVPQLLHVGNEDIKGTLNNISGKDKVVLAFNILGILLMGKDSHLNPIEYYSENSSLFLYELNDVTLVHNLINKMLSDFKLYLKNEDLANENNV